MDSDRRLDSDLLGFGCFKEIAVAPFVEPEYEQIIRITEIRLGVGEPMFLSVGGSIKP